MCTKMDLKSIIGLLRRVWILGSFFFFFFSQEVFFFVSFLEGVEYLMVSSKVMGSRPGILKGFSRFLGM